MAFHETRFPTDIAYGATGGPGYNTTIVTTSSGGEQRIDNWAQTRCKYNVGSGIKTVAQMEQFIAFFHARKGRTHGFRFKDWSDYTAIAQQCTLVTGTTKTYQMQKTYVDASGFHTTREIRKPVINTVSVFINGIKQTSGYVVDYGTGRIIFENVPGGIVTADFEFDVPCRFSNNDMGINLESWKISQWASIEIIEIKLPPNVSFFNTVQVSDTFESLLEYTAENVEQMIRTTNLAPEMRIKTRGRNVSGDGGGARYRISLTDEGKSWAISLNNGYFALLDQKDFVTYRMFGALLNGVDDDTPFMIQAHTYANSLYALDQTGHIKIWTCKVKQNDGIIYRSQPGIIEVYTDLDLSGSTIVFENESYDSEGWFYIGQKSETITTITLAPEQKAQLLQGTAYFTMLDNSIPSNVAITLTETDYTSKADGTYIPRKEMLIHDMQGICAGPLISSWINAGGQTVGTQTTVFSAEFTRISPHTLTITGCDVALNTTPGCNGILFTVNRHNTLIRDFLIRPIRSSLRNTIDRKAVFKVQNSYNVRFENIRGFNIAGRGNYEFIAGPGYVVSFENCCNVLIKDCRLLGYYKSIYAINCKDLIVRDSDIGGVQAFDNVSNIHVDNCIMYNHGIAIGYGSGLVTLNCCKLYSADIISLDYVPTLVELLVETGRCFTGKLSVQNCRIYASKTAAAGDTFSLIKATFSDKPSHVDILFRFPEIICTNIEVESTLLTAFYFMRIGGISTNTLTIARRALFENIETNVPTAQTYAVSFVSGTDVPIILSETGSKVLVYNCGTNIVSTASTWFGKTENPKPTTVVISNN
jgi:uncharacterized protein (TIGR02217 family)